MLIHAHKVVHTKLKCTWRHDVCKSLSLEWKSSDFFCLLVINECTWIYGTHNHHHFSKPIDP